MELNEKVINSLNKLVDLAKLTMTMPTTKKELEEIIWVAYNTGVEFESNRLEVMPKIVEDIAKLLLTEVMKCEMKHDENGHAYLKVPSRSLFDLGNQISEFLQSDSNFLA